jgi:hypothetical protein
MNTVSSLKLMKYGIILKRQRTLRSLFQSVEVSAPLDQVAGGAGRFQSLKDLTFEAGDNAIRNQFWKFTFTFT